MESLDPGPKPGHASGNRRDFHRLHQFFRRGAEGERALAMQADAARA